MAGCWPGTPTGCAPLSSASCAERGVTVHEDAEVVRVEPDAVVCADGRRVRFDEALWAVQAGAAPWLRDTGLQLDDKGFVAVDATLRSVNDSRIFAVGDVASVLPYPREKAGVFAVRQGPPLTANLRRALAGEALRPFKPQTNFLKLITTGDEYAVASRGRLSAEGRWVWRLKDWIDRRFMEKFQNVPAMASGMAAAPGEMRCAGCGAKVPADLLRRVLERLKPEGLDSTDDAAVLTPPADGRLMVQTVDFFRAFTSDPYLFGRIAANHALGDIYAMGAEPQTALAIACVPPAGCRDRRGRSVPDAARRSGRAGGGGRTAGRRPQRRRAGARAGFHHHRSGRRRPHPAEGRAASRVTG